MTLLAFEPGETIAKLVIGFFTLLGTIINWLTLKGVAGLLLVIAVFVVFGRYLNHRRKKSTKAHRHARSTSARSTPRGKRRPGAVGLESKYDSSEPSSSEDRPESPSMHATDLIESDDTKQHIRTRLAGSTLRPHHMQPEESTDVAVPEESRSGKRASS